VSGTLRPQWLSHLSRLFWFPRPLRTALEVMLPSRRRCETSGSPARHRRGRGGTLDLGNLGRRGDDNHLKTHYRQRRSAPACKTSRRAGSCRGEDFFLPRPVLRERVGVRVRFHSHSDSRPLLLEPERLSRRQKDGARGARAWPAARERLLGPSDRRAAREVPFMDVTFSFRMQASSPQGRVVSRVKNRPQMGRATSNRLVVSRVKNRPRIGVGPLVFRSSGPDRRRPGSAGPGRRAGFWRHMRKDFRACKGKQARPVHGTWRIHLVGPSLLMFGDNLNSGRIRAGFDAV
jgi:hypothetical protein